MSTTPAFVLSPSASSQQPWRPPMSLSPSPLCIGRPIGFAMTASAMHPALYQGLAPRGHDDRAIDSNDGRYRSISSTANVRRPPCDLAPSIRCGECLKWQALDRCMPPTRDWSCETGAPSCRGDVGSDKTAAGATAAAAAEPQQVTDTASSVDDLSSRKRLQQLRAVLVSAAAQAFGLPTALRELVCQVIAVLDAPDAKTFSAETSRLASSLCSAAATATVPSRDGSNCITPGSETQKAASPEEPSLSPGTAAGKTVLRADAKEFVPCGSAHLLSGAPAAAPPAVEPQAACAAVAAAATAAGGSLPCDDEKAAVPQLCPTSAPADELLEEVKLLSSQPVGGRRNADPPAAIAAAKANDETETSRIGGGAVVAATDDGAESIITINWWSPNQLPKLLPLLCSCQDLATLPTGTILVAAKDGGLVGIDDKGCRYTSWLPPGGAAKQQQHFGGSDAAAAARPHRPVAAHEREQVSTVDVTPEGLVVVGLRIARRVVVLAPPSSSDSGSIGQWRDVGSIQLPIQPWRLSVRGDHAAVVGMLRKQGSSSRAAPPVCIVSLLVGAGEEGGSDGDDGRVTRLDVGYAVAGVVLGDAWVIVSSWTTGNNFVQSFCRRSGTPLWRQEMDGIVADMQLSQSARLLYLLSDRHVAAVESESGRRMTRVLSFDETYPLEPTCMHLFNGSDGCVLVVGAVRNKVAMHRASGGGPAA